MVADGDNFYPTASYRNHTHTISIRDRGSDVARVPVLAVNRHLTLRRDLTDRPANIAD